MDYAMFGSDGKLPVASAPTGYGWVPAGCILMWSGLLAAIPSGWALCNGANGTPDLRSRFVKGAAAGAEAGATGGAATHTHAGHSNHAVTQPSAHSAHVVTQPSAHSAHVVTQPNGHSNHVVTQPDVHSAHVVTQPAAHSNHAALGTHAHELPFTKLSGATGALRMLAQSIFGSGTSRAPESVSAAPTANTTAAAVALSQAVSAGTPDAHSAHSGTGVDAHSAHAGAAVDAHSAHAGAAVDAHSAHAGTAVDAHSAHAGAAVDAHSAHDTPNSEPAYFALVFIMKL